MAKLISVHAFKSSQPQALRDVPIYIPSIVVVQAGAKLLSWQSDTLTFEKGTWLFAHAEQSLTFINHPANFAFRSIQICFLSPPSSAIMASIAAERGRNLTKSPKVASNRKLDFALKLLIAMQELDFTEQTQQHYLDAFYQILLEAGLLLLLFPGADLSMRERVCRFLSNEPAKAHSIDGLCKHLGQSRSTLTRRLADESTSYRELLSETRMLHALSLMQARPYKQLELALACGYQSETRFSQRFFKQFGLTPKQYMKTL
ncbi:helix-turn-helix domain-containing protein [Shewanella woodyi]|uniref:helix-turn-helix domain-containing protein n=1 Tax=Shewanella woodyi TaxID=60961 RepID=UPI0007EB9BED|nr:AraC family transcriptional regulator [Shewanella woodyi]